MDENNDTQVDTDLEVRECRDIDEWCKDCGKCDRRRIKGNAICDTCNAIRSTCCD